MGIKDLTGPKRLTLDEILAELEPDTRETLLLALATRKRGGTSRFFEFSGTRIEQALADDGYAITRGEIDEWRRANVD